ncbi:MAG: carbohydrate kinase [Candidatus Peregrinibacteria bacterium Greene0416_19]|nr:MAG: carbohydrate kinase [Candidatus Peregrinibacteria bacterium Greene0416_19]
MMDGMHRNPHSHKGENGKVAVIGGSPTIHGAPLLSALAAEAGGADLVFVCLPSTHQDVARATSLNFQVHPFHGNDLTENDLPPILELLATMDSCVIGPGLSRTPAALKVLSDLIDSASCALVLDAAALQSWTLDVIKGKTAVLTPHLGELERMGIEPDDIGRVAKEHGVTIHLKGSIDRIAAPDGTVTEVRGGNAGLTVGGTGDALAGLIAGLLAQTMEPLEACRLASTVIKRAGDVLFQEKGYAYTAREVIEVIPKVLQMVGM